MHRLLWLWSFVFCVACGSVTDVAPDFQDTALVQVGPARPGTDHLVIFVPGVFSSVDIFEPAVAQLPSRTAAFSYRYPGLDGRRAEPSLVLEEAAQDIAALVQDHPAQRVALVGYSAGAAIALEASVLMPPDRVVSLALISPSPERSGGLATRWRATQDLLSVATSLGSFDREIIWPEYWKILTFGRSTYRSGTRATEIEMLFDQERDNIIVPTPELTSSHTRFIQRWTFSAEIPTPQSRVGIFFGGSDPVFSRGQTQSLIDRLNAEHVVVYEGHGHIPFVTVPTLFDDVFAFTHQ